MTRKNLSKKSNYIDLTPLPKRAWWLQILILIVYMILMMYLIPIPL